MIYPFLARSLFGRSPGMEGLGAHGVDGLIVSRRHFDGFFAIRRMKVWTVFNGSKVFKVKEMS